MRKTEIILIRHGETVWNLERKFQGQLNSPLTERGIAQAQALAVRLQHDRLSHIYSSNLGRCYQTAQYVATIRGQPIIVDERFCERNYGPFQGLTRQEVQDNYPQLYENDKSGNPDYVIPNGESKREVLQRALTALEELSQRHVGERFLVVTHGAVLSILFRHFLGIPLHTPRLFKITNVGFNLVSINEGHWLVETLGDVSHLTN